MAISAVRTGSSEKHKELMLEEESLFFESLISLLGYYKKGVVDNVLGLKLPDLSTAYNQDFKGHDKKDEKASDGIEDDETKLVRFLNSLPSFVGEELEVYGPFEEEEIAPLPAKIANILISIHFIKNLILFLLTVH